jgi:oligopeptide transport system substrate-binding protein
MKGMKLRGVLLLILAVVLVNGVFAIGSRANTASSGASTSIKDLVLADFVNREIEVFNILYTQSTRDYINLTNMIDGLLEADPWGNLVPAIAREWGSNDGGRTWTFRLRQGVQWVDVNGRPKGENNANDWATALEWLLNFHKNDSVNSSMPIEMIQGAEDYYEWTKTLSAAEAKALRANRGSRFFQMVGIEIPDNYTIVYHCVAELPYFDTVALYNCLYPLSQAMIDELGGPDNVRSMDNRNMWYNGCYTMTTFINRNEKIYTKNPLYWDQTSERFDTVTIKIVDSSEIAYQLYQSGEIDYVTLTESNLNTIYNNQNHRYHNYLIPDPLSKYSYQIHFNYDKKNRDGSPDTNWNTAIANTSFRRAMYYGLNLVDFWRRINAITPMPMENNYYTIKGLVNTTDGTEYTELVRRELGLRAPDGRTPARLDAAKFAQYKAQAMRELTALGVTFPIRIDYPIVASNQTALDNMLIMQRIFSESLGSDFVNFQISTYVASLRQEILNPGFHSMMLAGWQADYGDPQNYLAQYTYNDDNAYFSTVYTGINRVAETAATRDLIAAFREYTRLVRAADAIKNDKDARYRAFARAEAYMLDNALVIPAYYAQEMALGKIDNTSKQQAIYGIMDTKYKNWRTNSNGITTAEAAAAAARHAQGKP